MPLAQAHPFEPMPVTHEEDMQEVNARKTSYKFVICSASAVAGDLMHAQASFGITKLQEEVSESYAAFSSKEMLAS